MHTTAAAAPAIATSGAASAPPEAVVADMPAASLGLCAVAIGSALQVNFGQYHPLAIVWLTAALLGVALCIAKRESRLIQALEARRTVILSIGLAIEFILLLSRSPGATGALSSEAHLLPFRIGIVVAALLTGLGIWRDDGWRWVALVGLLIAHMILGLWVLRAAPDPGIDVCVFQRDAAGALLLNENPYAMTFRDPYGGASTFYGTGVSVGGRVQFGYPYPPLSLLLVTPAHRLGDFRYAQLIAMTLAGALVGLARPGRVAFAAAALLLFTPRGFFVLEAGWTEPFAVLFLAATVFVACRSRASAAVPLGLLVATKQYLPLVLLAAPLLRRGGRGAAMSLSSKAAAVAAVVTLPMALANLQAFVHSVVVLQFRQPFREDALSYLALLSHLGLGTPPAWIAFIAAGLAGVIALRRCPRTPAGFAAAVALILLAFFAFNKQAFCNYYHLVIGALCCAVCASKSVLEPSAAPR